MEHESPIRKAWREFAMADPDDCAREWAACLALGSNHETASNSSPTASTSSLHSRVGASTATATVSASTATHDSSPATKDDLSPEARRVYDYIVGNTDEYVPVAAITATSSASMVALASPPASVLSATAPKETDPSSVMPATCSTVCLGELEAVHDAVNNDGTHLAASTPSTCSTICLAGDTSATTTSASSTTISTNLLVSTELSSSATAASSTRCGFDPEPAAGISTPSYALDLLEEGASTSSLTGDQMVLKFAPITVDTNATSLAVVVPINCLSECPSHKDVVSVSVLNSYAARTLANCSGCGIDKSPSLLAEAYEVFHEVPPATEIVPWPPPRGTRARPPMIHGQDLFQHAQQRYGKEFSVMDSKGNWNAIWLDVELKPPWLPLGVCMKLPMDVSMIHTMVSLATWPMECSNSIVASGKRNDTNCDIAQPVLISSEYVDLAIVSVPRLFMDIPFLISADVHQDFMGLYSMTAVLSRLIILVLRRTAAVLWPIFQSATVNTDLLLPWDPGQPWYGGYSKLGNVEYGLLVMWSTARGVAYFERYSILYHHPPPAEPPDKRYHIFTDKIGRKVASERGTSANVLCNGCYHILLRNQKVQTELSGKLFLFVEEAHVDDNSLGYPIHCGSETMQLEIAWALLYLYDFLVQPDRLLIRILAVLEHLYEFSKLSGCCEPWTSWQIQFCVPGTRFVSPLYALLLCLKARDGLEMRLELSMQTDKFALNFCSIILHNMGTCSSLQIIERPCFLASCIQPGRTLFLGSDHFPFQLSSGFVKAQLKQTMFKWSDLLCFGIQSLGATLENQMHLLTTVDTFWWLIVFEHWFIPWEPRDYSPGHDFMEIFTSFAITCEQPYSVIVDDNLLVARYWMWCMRCLQLDSDRPSKFVVFLQPKPPWSKVTPTISVAVADSLHIIGVSMEFNQSGLSASHGSQLSQGWILYLPVTCIMQCGSELMPWGIADSRHGILTYTIQILISWDPGGSVLVLHAAASVNWNSSQQSFLHLIWDPGGSMQHRLEGKPNLKEGRLSTTHSIRDLGLVVGCHLVGWACSEATGGGYKREGVDDDQLGWEENERMASAGRRG